ncbi:hypothetical protein SAMN05216474_0447 [Lishizhenia tianjinensis]|uniref:Uncharacterized protein n=1 Tax=Lishizhenia tianjinensis TaxID=477690 RepID=A0A1I6XVA9_9FLAO|nr:hypothetical protein [Lishizhenia tianjinensis]SFT41754.1 hypothetical protein SAMN05216474_0447 [Lishizhenia tianjinensis]
MHIILYNSVNTNVDLNDLEEHLIDIDLRYRATELVTTGHMGFEEMQQAVKRAMNICKVAGVEVRKHFKAIYLCREGILLRDWRLSALARKLVVINGDPNNLYVAKVQIDLFQ